jgi:hypothetical protein
MFIDAAFSEETEVNFSIPVRPFKFSSTFVTIPSSISSGEAPGYHREKGGAHGFVTYVTKHKDSEKKGVDPYRIFYKKRSELPHLFSWFCIYNHSRVSTGYIVINQNFVRF